MSFWDEFFKRGQARSAYALPRQPATPQGKPYTMAMVDGESAEITMYGEIVEAQPVDWWTGEPVPGAYIVQEEFLKDLEAIAGAKTLTIHMNSMGGDAGVSVLIHNRRQRGGVHRHHPAGGGAVPPAGAGGKGNPAEMHRRRSGHVRRLPHHVRL